MHPATFSQVPETEPNRTKTVLIIEDNPHDREIFRLALEQADYQVVTVANWDDGLEALNEGPADLILLDLILPGGDTGWTVAEELRGESTTASIPIIVVSAHVAPHLDSRLRNLGVECCLEKPLDPDDIVHHVNRLIGPATPA
jgi:CheY-like chemotaxis protein